MGRVFALVRCQIKCCRYPSHLLYRVRMYEGQPICEMCYELYICKNTDQLSNVETDWDILPDISLEDLRT